MWALYPASLQVSIARREGLAKISAKGFPASMHPTALACRSPSSVSGRSVLDVCRPEALQSVSPWRISHKVPRLISSLYPGLPSPKGRRLIDWKRNVEYPSSRGQPGYGEAIGERDGAG